MSQTDYIAILKCQHCQATSSLQDELEMYNKVSPEIGIWEVGEGEVMEIDLEDISTDFFRINEPTTNRVRCAELWVCPTCQRYNFAEIIFLLREDDGIIEKIKSVVMTPDYLNEIHYLAQRIDDWAKKFTNTPVFSSLKPSEEEIKNFREFLVRLQEEKKE